MFDRQVSDIHLCQRTKALADDSPWASSVRASTTGQFTTCLTCLNRVALGNPSTRWWHAVAGFRIEKRAIGRPSPHCLSCRIYSGGQTLFWRKMAFAVGCSVAGGVDALPLSHDRDAIATCWSLCRQPQPRWWSTSSLDCTQLLLRPLRSSGLVGRAGPVFGNCVLACMGLRLITHRSHCCVNTFGFSLALLLCGGGLVGRRSIVRARVSHQALYYQQRAQVAFWGMSMLAASLPT